MQSRRKAIVKKLMHEYNVKIVLGNYAYENDIQFSKLQIRDSLLPLNNDYAGLNAANIQKGLVYLCSLVEEIALIVEYELPFECVMSGKTCHFLFMQQRFSLKNNSSSFISTVQFISFLHYNILSLCNSQGMTIGNEDVIYAFYHLLKCTEQESFGCTEGKNLNLSFRSVNNQISAAIQLNPPDFSR